MCMYMYMMMDSSICLFVCLLYVNVHVHVGRVARRSQRFEEAREKRIAFEEALETVLPKLEETETLLSQLKDGGIGKGGNKSLKEQLDIMEVNYHVTVS